MSYYVGVFYRSHIFGALMTWHFQTQAQVRPQKIPYCQMSYYAEFGRSMSNGVGVNSLSQEKLGVLGPSFLEWGAD